MVFDLNHLIEQIHKDKGIPKEALIEALESAMMTAAHRKLGVDGELEAQYNSELGEVELFQFKTVVEKETDPNREIEIGRAQTLDAGVVLGDSLGEKVDSKILGRIAVQTAKQVIIQKLRDAERDIVVKEYEPKLGEVLAGVVRRHEKGNIIVDLNKTEGIIYHRDQVLVESYKPGDRIQAYFFEIDTFARGPMILLSRRHPYLVKALFELEVPEISEGIVDIKAVARDPGVRTKIAVYSTDGDVDPVGACVGMKGSRVQSVVQELRGEKIDIVLWDNDPARFVCNAIAPAQVAKVIVIEKKHSMEIIVPDDQLSLAIGRKGQNVRLAANLTGWNIDVFSESKVEELAKFAKGKLVEELGISDSLATVLHGHAFRSVEEIAESSPEEFLGIPGMEKETLEGIYAKAEAAVQAKKEEVKGPALALAEVPSPVAERLAVEASRGAPRLEPTLDDVDDEDDD